MSVLFVLVPTVLLVVAAAVVAYLWAARRGQFDDLTTPALRVLHDDEPAPRPEEASDASRADGAARGPAGERAADPPRRGDGAPPGARES